MQWFKVPSKIYFERNSIEYLKQMREMDRVFIVTDRSMVDLGYVNLVTNQLEKRRNKVQVQLFCDVEPDPSIQTVKRGLSLMQAFRPDTIIAIGGGSAMDAAKGMWLFYEEPEVNFNDLKQKFMDIRKRAFRYPELGKKSKLVCIPTTSGTGSEVTCWATIWDPEKEAKRSVESPSNYAWAAIADPELSAGMPRTLAVSSALDAMAHAVESYWARGTNCVSRALSLGAIRTVRAGMEKLLSGDKAAGDYMSRGSLLAGMAFSNTRTTACHSISYPLTMDEGIPHGTAVSMLLAPVMEFNFTAIYGVEELLDALGVSDWRGLDAFVRDALIRSGQPASLSGWGVPREELPLLAGRGITKGRADNNPVELARENVLRILEKIY